MKLLLIGLLVLGSFSTFANDCVFGGAKELQATKVVSGFNNKIKKDLKIAAQNGDEAKMEELTVKYEEVNSVLLQVSAFICSQK